MIFERELAPEEHGMVGVDTGGRRWGYYRRFCDGPGLVSPGSFSADYFAPMDGGGPGAVVIDIEALKRNARANAPLPTITPKMAPSGDEQRPVVVGMRTWLWIDGFDGRPTTGQASDPTGTVSVSVTGTPVKVVWSMGEPGSEPVVCDGPGVPWRRGLPESATTCAFTSRRVSARQPGGVFQGTVTITWEWEWSMDGAEPTPLGAPSGQSSTFTYTTEEIQALN